ncbi:hypothetical protein GDO86_013788 [Hymenochirus boettgeri]|uniref:Transmembrane protein 238 n=1 Tax=Hymenochirus boettgeri TaxID=247094 RepID=A0A8T2JUL3_9PIPI|nr:hypothetical protein GDO86_013788 [Hymenochirus boettgeri]
MASARFVGRCPVAFILAMSFDILGISLILSGIFANLKKNGRSFGEFLIYTGGILVFVSLLLWLAWYSANLEISMDELLRDYPETPRRSNLAQLARKVSESLSLRNKRRVLSSIDPLGQPATASHTRDPHITLAPHIFINWGFMDQMDVSSSIQDEKALELSSISSCYGYTVTLPVHLKPSDQLTN